MNIQKEIEEMKQSMLEDLAVLVAIPSVLDEAGARVHAPFGKEIRRAFDAFIKIAERLGFTVNDDDGYAVDAQIGEGDAYIGVLGHLDVVGAGNLDEWDHDPFVMQQKGNLLYGRGVNDDKGPLLAALYAAALIKKKGFALKYPIRIIAGGAEETSWACMQHYFQHHEQPICGFSPDGNFPIVNGEKGILQVRFLFPEEKNVHFRCKRRLNYVCDDLMVCLPNDPTRFRHADEIKNEGMNWVLRYFGKTALSRNPQRGDNAIFHFVKDICENADDSWQVPAVLHMIAEQFADDFYGEKSKLSAKDANMGTNSVCVMSLNTIENGIELCVDIRYVKSTTKERLLARLNELAQQYGATVEILREKRLLYVDEQSPLIQALQHAYETVMHEKAGVFTKGGASYARVLDQGVAFGATFDGEDPRPHMANECQNIQSLMRACEIYYEALFELAVSEC